MSNTNLRGYGDVDNLNQDIKALRDILSRQGQAFAIDVLAETVGETANKFGLSETERNQLLSGLKKDFINALEERL